MEINGREQDGVYILEISGSVDALTAGELTAYLEERLAQRRNRLVMGLSAVEYMSSAGLRSILTALKASRSMGGDFRIAGPQPGVAKMLEISGFANIVRIFPGVDDAVASFRTDRQREPGSTG